jgi:hypothetical protein
MQLTDIDIERMLLSRGIAFKVGEPSQSTPPQHSKCIWIERDASANR